MATDVIFKYHPKTILAKIAAPKNQSFSDKMTAFKDIMLSRHGVAAIGAAAATALALQYIRSRKHEQFKEVFDQAYRSDPKLADKMARDFLKKHKLGRKGQEVMYGDYDYHSPAVAMGEVERIDPKTKKKVVTKEPIIVQHKDPKKQATKLRLDDPAVHLHELGHYKRIKEKNPVTRAAMYGNSPIGKLARIPLIGLNKPAYHAANVLAAGSLIREEQGASEHALDYIMRHGPPKEKTRARRLLKATHDDYVVDQAIGVSRIPLITGAGIAALVASIKAQQKIDALKSRKSY